MNPPARHAEEDSAQPPRYSRDELDAARRVAIDNFRRERLEEPLEDYLEAFEEYLGVAEELLETTVDLLELEAHALDILADLRLQHAFRYLAGPPISADDLLTLADAASLSPGALARDPEAVRRIVQTVLVALDRRRFPWVQEAREPEPNERAAAALASAALMATRRLETRRRTTGKEEQEAIVDGALQGARLVKVETRRIRSLDEAPGPGEFCRESYLGPRKADFIVRLWDRRVLAVECKVSNSATNSVKRLNNDAAAKGVEWRRRFGDDQVVPAALLSGVYKLHNLVDAQATGLTLFWAHDLGYLLNWIESTRRSAGARARRGRDAV